MRRLLLIPLVAALALAACDSEPNVALTRPLPIGASAQDVLDGAREAMTDVVSYVWTSDITLPADENGNEIRARLEGFWMAPDDYQFIATWENDGVTTVIDHRWVEGRAFQRVNGVWDEVFSRDPLGVPRYQGWTEVGALENVDFSRALGNATAYEIVGELTNDDPRLGDDGPTRSVVQVAASHLDLLVSSVTVETTLADGRTFSQASTFGRFNVNGAINLPEGFTSRATPTP